MNQLIPVLTDRAPALVAAAGARASYRFLEFFVVIAEPNRPSLLGEPNQMGGDHAATAIAADATGHA